VRPRHPTSRNQPTLSQATLGFAKDDMNTDPVRPPVPPFMRDTATQKVRAAEDAWNSRDPLRVSLAYTVDSKWRNRAEHLESREQIVAFLERKWAREL